MSDDPYAIRLVEGEYVAYTFTVKRGGSAIDVSSYTITFYVHDDEADAGTNQVDGGATAWVTDGSDGQFTYTFTDTDTTLASGTELRGTWRAKMVNGSIVEWTKARDIYIERNEMES